MSGIRKYYNLLALTGSYLVSRYFGRNTVWGMPYSIGIELTNNCNLHCRHCPSGSGQSSRSKGYISSSLMNRIRDELSDYILTTMFYFQGESMMHPEFFDLLDSVGKMGPIISTNGHFLDSDSCRKLAELNTREIIVSVDGITEASYNAYREGGRLSKVMDGVTMLAKELKKKKKLGWLTIQVLVSRYNENELDRLSDFARNLGVRIHFKSMQLIGEENNDDILPQRSEFRRYKLDNGRLDIKSRRPNHCYRLWSNPVITWDGKVLPCCFDKDADYIMGDLNRESFEEIWKGSRYNSFRNSLLKNRAGIDICNNCTEGLHKSVKV